MLNQSVFYGGWEVARNVPGQIIATSAVVRQTGIFGDFALFCQFGGPGRVPPGAHRDFLQVARLGSSRSLTWTRKRPSILARQDIVNFGSSHDTISPGHPDGKEGTDNVYLDTQVMGSNPGIRSRSYGKVPKFPGPPEVAILWPDSVSE